MVATLRGSTMVGRYAGQSPHLSEFVSNVSLYPSSLTFSLALVVQAIVIDILGVGTKVILRMMGPFITLLIVQSKGWPFITFCWAIINFGLLYGKHPFAHNWGYFQDAIGLFNADNPSGDVVENEWNRRALLIGVFVSLFVALKRFLVGLVLGRQTFCESE